MSKYGELAKLAAQKSREGLPPKQAWNTSAEIVFPKQKASREKGCPKSAFLGLAELGLIRGVPAGNYTRSKYNKQYGLDAVSVLSTNPLLSHNTEELWKTIMKGEIKQHNEQMTVVKALWDNKGINVNIEQNQ